MTNPGFGRCQIPTIGLSSLRAYWHELNDSANDIAHDLPSGTYVIGDAINNNVMPNGQTVAFPTILDTDGTYFVADAWTGFTVDGLARSGVSATGNVFVFTTNDPMPTGQLPYRRLVRDFHIDLITNAAEIKALNGGTLQTYTDTDSQQRYGTRTRFYETTSVDDAAALTTAQLWVNRYGYKETFDMTQSSLQVTDSMVQGHGGDPGEVARPARRDGRVVGERPGDLHPDRQRAHRRAHHRRAHDRSDTGGHGRHAQASPAVDLPRLHSRRCGPRRAGR